MVFIVVEQDGAYSCKEWRVIGVYDNKLNAVMSGLNVIVETALKPYIVDFYRDRNGEFAKAVALPEVHIEKWDVNGTKMETTYIGFQDKPFLHSIDSMLKAEEDNQRSCEDLLHTWKLQLSRGIVPTELQDVIVDEIII